ncbi:50S ribosomal protein L11 methyltransferase [Zavarzinia sp. CC-PAN008]|uniref:50S ribosomal protein L11 methyltransferase n=1 Tax=Zavarzinia sp. CC-PAN008 TaxID=3243332 RepID=UPI003F742308
MSLWRASVIVTTAQVNAAEAACALDALAISTFEHGPDWRVEALFEDEPSRDGLAAGLAAAGIDDVSSLEVGPVEARDWLAEAHEHAAPRRQSRFWIAEERGEPAPPGTLPIVVDAVHAFGTGRHGTTAGCLLALEDIARRRRIPRMLDLGCGSGILAIAGARLWHGHVVAVDIDPLSVAATARNARASGVRLTCFAADGAAEYRLKAQRPFPLIVANILARPLVLLAPGIMQRLARGGTLVLSGLLVKQENQVLHAYREQGLVFRARRRIGDWSTLVLQRP